MVAKRRRERSIEGGERMGGKGKKQKAKGKRPGLSPSSGVREERPVSAAWMGPDHTIVHSMHTRAPEDRASPCAAAGTEGAMPQTTVEALCEACWYSLFWLRARCI